MTMNQKKALYAFGSLDREARSTPTFAAWKNPSPRAA